jgi:hypothetical protein
VCAADAAVPVAGLDVPVAAHGAVVRPVHAQLGLAAALARVALAEVEVLARPAAPVAGLPARRHVHLLRCVFLGFFFSLFPSIDSKGRGSKRDRSRASFEWQTDGLKREEARAGFYIGFGGAVSVASRVLIRCMGPK